MQSLTAHAGSWAQVTAVDVQSLWVLCWTLLCPVWFVLILPCMLVVG